MSFWQTIKAAAVKSTVSEMCILEKWQNKIVARKHTRSIYSIQLDMAEMAKEKAAAQHRVGS